MGSNNHLKGKCEICGKYFSFSRLFPIKMIRDSVLNSIVEKNGGLDLTGYICSQDLHKMRIEHIEKILHEDKGAFSLLEKEVMESLKDQEIISENINSKFEKDLNFGEKLADKIARFGGSWRFIITFISVILIWMAFNVFFLTKNIFDPYPFILLNLVLSCLAALQAPVILMSQNRQAEKERLRANEDYCTNLKAELEIQQVHFKLDLFMKRQWESLLELQKIQIELAEELLDREKRKQK